MAVRTSHKLVFLVFMVCLITAAVCSPALRNGFCWDDDLYLGAVASAGSFSLQAWQAMALKNVGGNFHPLTLLSLALDRYAGGTGPLLFHCTSVLLHVLNTALVFFFIYTLSGCGGRRGEASAQAGGRLACAVIVSLLFGVHPLHVESVAWVSQRKDVLYAFFFFASLIAYLGYVRRGRPMLYALSLVLFVLSLLSKGMAVSLALTLTAVDYYAGRRLRSPRVAAEKIPFLVLALLFGIAAVAFQQAGGAISDRPAAGLGQRMVFACYGFTQYLMKLALPVQLSAFYPYPQPSAGGGLPPSLWLYVPVPLAAAWACITALRRSRLVAFGMLFFAVNIVFVLQLLPVGLAVMADRYSYVSSVGVFLLIAAGYKQAARKLSSRPAACLMTVYLAILAFFSFQRCAVWKDSFTLWSDVAAAYQYSPVVWNNLGNARSIMLSDFEGAIADYSRALELSPHFYRAFNNRGM